ncbi:MAG TPA: SGNH/GDSL hydrolase family protein [Bacillales bacterium]
MFKSGEKVLFQGDSITDAGRDYGKGNHMGAGYAMMAAAWFSALYPEKQVTFYNRGISGNRVQDLRERWQSDCLDLQPDWVSILIGINDCWRRYDQNNPTPVGQFESDYRYLLKTVRDKLNAKLILCEPFVLPFPEDREQWRQDLDPKIQVVRKLAREFNAVLVPFDGAFAQVTAKRSPEFWAHDGVHPSSAGHALMAQKWLDTVVR